LIRLCRVFVMICSCIAFVYGIVYAQSLKIYFRMNFSAAHERESNNFLFNSLSARIGFISRQAITHSLTFCR
jgi:hypothetical protein